MVTHAYKNHFQNDMDESVRVELKQRGCRIVTAAHALSAGERSISMTYRGVYPLELAAQILRMFGSGTKVAAECALMAVSSGDLEGGAPCVAVGGSVKGADTAWILTPSVGLLDLKFNELLCKPALYDENSEIFR